MLLYSKKRFSAGSTSKHAILILSVSTYIVMNINL